MKGGGSTEKVMAVEVVYPPRQRGSGSSLIRGASLVTQLVKNLPEMQGTWVRSLGWQDPLGKGKATHASSLA